MAADARPLIVGGGDGSVSAVAGAVAGSASRLGILPMGTLNQLARELGIPVDLDEAAAVIAAGKARGSTLPNSTAAPSSTTARSGVIR